MCRARRYRAERSPPRPRALVGAANRASQSKDGRGGVTVGRAFLFAVALLRLGAVLGFLDPAHHVCAIRHFSPASVILRPEVFKLSLGFPAVARLIVVSFVKDKPQLETGIGARDSDAMLLAQRYRFLKTGVSIAVEHCPYPVAFLEGIFLFAGFGFCRRFFCDRHGDTHPAFHGNQCTGESALDRLEISRFGVPPLTEQDEAPLRLAVGAAALQIRCAAAGSSVVGQGPKPDRRRVPRRSGLADTLSQCRRPCGSGYR